LLQISDFTGSLGVSFLIFLVNGLIAELLTIPLFQTTVDGPKLTRPVVARVGSVAVIFIFTLLYGFFRISTAKFEPGPTVALLQSSQMQRYMHTKTGEEMLLEYETLLTKVAKQNPKPNLIVWPETSYPFGYVAIDPKLPADELAKQIRSYDPEGKPEDWIAKQAAVDGHLHNWTDALGIPMMVGSTTYDFRSSGFQRFNSLILFEPRKVEIQSYHKMHLVPFGEYVPLLETFPWLTVLTPYRNGHIPTLAHGAKTVHFEQGPYRYAAAICFEDTLPQVVNEILSHEHATRPADVLINSSNDGWFTTKDEQGIIHGTAEHEMHLASSVFRAIEHRTPLARAANTGISAVIDGNGKVIDQLPAGKSDVLFATVPLDSRTSLYTKFGDWFGLLCLAITLGLIPMGIVCLRNRSLA
jgi:apolipoprotein N-acyltransferase